MSQSNPMDLAFSANQVSTTQSSDNVRQWQRNQQRQQWESAFLGATDVKAVEKEADHAQAVNENASPIHAMATVHAEFSHAPVIAMPTPEVTQITFGVSNALGWPQELNQNVRQFVQQTQATATQTEKLNQQAIKLASDSLSSTQTQRSLLAGQYQNALVVKEGSVVRMWLRLQDMQESEMWDLLSLVRQSLVQENIELDQLTVNGEVFWQKLAGNR